jgi:hypothetical protein
MKKEDGNPNAIEAILHRIERKYAQDPLFNEVCALAVLCLLARAGKPVADPADLKSLLEACGTDGAQLDTFVETLGGHWHEYGEFAGRFGEDELVDLFETRYVRLIRGKAQASPSMDALSLELLGLKAGESCLDICAGAGFFMNEAWMAMSHLAGRGGTVNLAGIGFNRDLARYAAVLSAIRGTGGDFQIADCFDPRHLRVRYDKVHCTTPFGLNVRQLDFANVRETVARSFPGFPPITLTSADWLFAARAVAALKEGGKAVVVMPRAALSGAQSAPYRRHFLANRWIECVAAFPEGAYPGTPAAVALVVFAKGASGVKLCDLAAYEHAKGDPTVFNHARIARDLALLVHYGDIATKPPEEILARGGDLDPAVHLAAAGPHGTTKALGELCGSICRGAVLPKSVLGTLLPPSGGAGGIAYLSPKNIADGLVDGDLPEFPGMPPGAEPALAGPGDVVVTRSGPAFKVAVVERGPCVADGNLVVCRPKGVDPHYLAAFFATAEGAKWLRRTSSGMQHTLSTRKLATIPVPVAPPGTERRIADAMARKLGRVRELRRELKENLSGIGSVFAEAMDNGGTGDGD